jgi:hypothetical protein
MHRNVTAIYRTHAIADKVRREVEALGISKGHTHVIPDNADDVPAGSHRDEGSYRSDLDHLGLPEGERHSYEHALRRGDHVVSVRVNKGDEAHLDRITDIMRHPEAHDFEQLDTEFRDAPRQDADRAGTAPMGRRDTDYDYGGSGLRGFTYDDPYVPRHERV